MSTPEELGRQMLDATKAFVLRALAPVSVRLEQLERMFAALPAPRDGKSAYGLAVERGYAGTELQWLDSLRGEPGASVKGDAGTVDAIALQEAAQLAVRAIELPAPHPPTPEEIRMAALPDIERLIAALPVPKDGLDASPEAVQDAVERAIAQIPAPKDGEPGRSVTIEELRPLVAELAQACVDGLPKPQNGKDIDPQALATMVSEAVTRAVEALPPARNGDAGRDSDPVAVATILLPELREMVAAIPRPKDGEPGKSVTVEEFRALFEAESAKALLDFERRAADVLQRAIDRIDSAMLEHALGQLTFDVQDNGDGDVMIAFVRGESRKEFLIRLPRLDDAGVYRDETEYRKGDGVTFGGSFFISQTDKPEGRPGDSDAWRLAVKRGRDGKDFRPDEPTPHKTIRVA